MEINRILWKIIPFPNRKVYIKGSSYIILGNWMIIRKVWKNKGNNQLLITIPKDSNISEGDYVELIKIDEK